MACSAYRSVSDDVTAYSLNYNVPRITTPTLDIFKLKDHTQYNNIYSPYDIPTP